MLPHHGASFFYKKNTVKLPLHDIFVPNGNIFIVIFCTYIIYYFIMVCKFNLYKSLQNRLTECSIMHLNSEFKRKTML